MSSEGPGGDIYDIAVVGGGAAGAMAAIRSSELGKRVVLVERNDAIGKKILITGKGRCNLTNTAPIEEFIGRFGRQGKFLRSAFYAFFNEDLIEFFRSRGLEVKAERQGRVFPATDKARSVVDVLEKSLADNQVEVRYNARMAAIKRSGDTFLLELQNGETIKAKHVILATGGASYKVTGSSGDGFRIAEELGHSIAPLKPALVPLKTEEGWIKDLQGLGLENIRVTFKCGKKSMVSGIGELMFTHFGVSGPLVLDMSGDVIDLLKDHKAAQLFIDLKPALRPTQLEGRLLNDFMANGKAQVKTVMKGYLPQRLIDIFLVLSGVKAIKEVSQITQGERRAIVGLFKALPLTVTGALPLEEAMVTGGGVTTTEIDPRTMESKVVPGIYFAGEMIDGSAASGGYNLQQAFSTGYLAGQSAARST